MDCGKRQDCFSEFFPVGLLHSIGGGPMSEIDRNTVTHSETYRRILYPDVSTSRPSASLRGVLFYAAVIVACGVWGSGHLMALIEQLRVVLDAFRLGGGF
jgi:hypothetical protein